VTEGDLRAGAAWFAAVGAVIGLAVASAGWVASRRAPVLAAAVLAVSIDAILTGGLHLDGLADTADGLGAKSGGRDALTVMRDPAVGAFGVVALILDLCLRIAATAALLGGPFPWAIVGATAAARLAPLALARRLPYLRPKGGAGVWIEGGVPAGAIGVGLATAVIASLPGGPWTAVAIVASVCVVTIAIGVAARRSLGGATGDVFGAATELAQTLALTAAACVLAP
jgi:adenosylcobinamide-GDP ribazoletransferase